MQKRIRGKTTSQPVDDLLSAFGVGREGESGCDKRQVVAALSGGAARSSQPFCLGCITEFRFNHCPLSQRVSGGSFQVQASRFLYRSLQQLARLPQLSM